MHLWGNKNSLSKCSGKGTNGSKNEILFYCIINLLLIKSKDYQQNKCLEMIYLLTMVLGAKMSSLIMALWARILLSITVDVILQSFTVFGGTDVIIDNGYGGYGGMDMGMGMAMGMGMGMGMGYGGNTTIIENRGRTYWLKKCSEVVNRWS